MRLPVLALLFAIIPACALSDIALAEDENQAMYYAAAGSGGYGSSFAVGAGTQVDALEINAIDLGKVNGGTAKFVGLSLVQNTTVNSGFSGLFRLGLGRETTTFPGGVVAHQMWFSNGIYLGLGARYRISDHFALRADVNRIRYAASPDGKVGRLRYPVTLSAMVVF